jgi:hypothetical protein
MLKLVTVKLVSVQCVKISTLARLARSTFCERGRVSIRAIETIIHRYKMRATRNGHDICLDSQVSQCEKVARPRTGHVLANSPGACIQTVRVDGREVPPWGKPFAYTRANRDARVSARTNLLKLRDQHVRDCLTCVYSRLQGDRYEKRLLVGKEDDEPA